MFFTVTARDHVISSIYSSSKKTKLKEISRCLEVMISAGREVKDSRSSEMFQSCNFGTSECAEVASELVRDIFEFFDLFFQGKEIIMRKYYFWKK